LDDLNRIGIDEISWRRGQCSLTLVVDHVTSRLVGATEGRSKKVVESFFAQLGQQRCAQLTHVSSDGAQWILGPVEQHCPNASICLDPFHVVQWATSALDKVRRAIWNQTRRSGQKTQACSGGLQGRVSQRAEFEQVTGAATDGRLRPAGAMEGAPNAKNV
jgi:transposase